MAHLVLLFLFAHDGTLKLMTDLWICGGNGTGLFLSAGLHDVNENRGNVND